MLGEARNRLLTEVGPGKPMGALLRRYWQPIAAVAELDDAPTKPIRLLGEDLVLYKDLSGQYGLLDRHCPHRSADLSYGIVESCGLRCNYHGWRFDADRRLQGTTVRGHRRAGDPLPRPDPHQGVQGAGAGGIALGLSRPRAGAPAAELGAVHLAERLRPDRVLRSAVQLVPVPGELDRPGAFRVDARQLGQPARRRQRRLRGAAPEAGVRRIRLRPGVSPRARRLRRDAVRYGRSAASACGRMRCSPATISNGACRSTTPTR